MPLGDALVPQPGAEAGRRGLAGGRGGPARRAPGGAHREAPALPEGTYYHYQLIGLEVRTAEGDDLGRVVEVLATGGTDVYVVHGPRGEALLPATSEVVAAIDLEAGRMTVTPLPGMPG